MFMYDYCIDTKLDQTNQSSMYSFQLLISVLPAVMVNIQTVFLLRVSVCIMFLSSSRAASQLQHQISLVPHCLFIFRRGGGWVMAPK